MEDKRSRPLGIWMIVGLELFNASITLLDLALGTNISDPKFQNLTAASEPARAFVIVWGALVILASVLLWRIDRRGWALMMVLVGLSLIANLGIWWSDPARTQWLSMSLSVLTAFYLNTSSVRSLFLTKHEVSRLTLSDRQR